MTNYFHGEDAAGILSLMNYSEVPGLTLADGFDIEPALSDLVRRRHSIPVRVWDARRLFNASMAGIPTPLRQVDLVMSGSPCQRVSRAAHFNTSTEPNADDDMNALYPDQVHTIVAHAAAAVAEYLTDVRKLRSPAGSPNAQRPPGWRHAGMLGNFARHSWVTHETDINAWMHGSPGARRRVYTSSFSPAVVAAAGRAGIAYQHIEPIPFRQRRVLQGALADQETIDQLHPGLLTKRRLTVPKLRGGGMESRQVARVDMGGRETEPVGDARLPAIPIKCFGETPLVMLPDGRVRRTLTGEFAAIGSVPWSVDRGMGQEPTIEQQRAAKVMIGNTWDGVITNKIIRAALTYMQPYLNERAHEEAEPQRTGARFTTIVMMMMLPARRAWRRLREAASAETREEATHTKAAADLGIAARWRSMAAHVATTAVRRATGFMGEARCAYGIWRLVMSTTGEVVRWCA